jgi:hypothetical protein
MEDLNSQLPQYKPIGNIYSYDQLHDFLTDPQVLLGMQYEVQAGKRLSYINCPAAFDIETSSFYVDENSKSDASKVAIMYVWQFGINGSVIYGREWREFITTINSVISTFNLSSHRRLLIYVHNLSFEFQFIKELFKWDAVFSLKTRVPIYAVSGGIEFRCSYKLSNYSLEYLGSHMLHKYFVTKKSGDLEYSLLRHSRTPLTSKELDYAIYDDYVVMAFIREKMEEEGGDISKIPLTNTGYVRRHCRYKTLESPNYRHIIDSLVVNYKEYGALKKAFMGGFTHANVEHVNQHLYNVDSNDIASDYPARICLEYFPMTKARYQSTVSSIKELDTLLNKYCVVFKLQLYNILPLVPYENILSISRCKFLTPEDNYVANNGRLVSYPGWLETWVTEIDFKNLSEFYTWEDWAVSDLYIYERDYLPTEFVNCVLDFYEAKTQLKGVEGKEVEYMVAKNMLNSTYGMMVTDIVREEALYNSTGWTKESPNLEDSIVNYNKSWNRFLFYPWGIYVTAHARDQIFTIIKQIQSDYVYSDTDSIKMLNYEKHKKVFEKYNSEIISKIFKSANHHGISPTRFMPKDPSGKQHPIGLFEFDGHYDHFKTCGAKRYLYTTDGKTGLTVAGLGKAAGLNYLLNTYGPDLDSIYKAFTDGLYVPPGSSGKLTHTYLDKPRMGVVVDYQGTPSFYYEKSATHLEPAPFCMSMLDSYLRYIYGIAEDIYRE